MILDKLTRNGLAIVAAVAALNWGLVEFADFDLLLDGLALTSGSTEYQAVIGGIALAAVILAYDSVLRVMDE